MHLKTKSKFTCYCWYLVSAVIEKRWNLNFLLQVAVLFCWIIKDTRKTVLLELHNYYSHNYLQISDQQVRDFLLYTAKIIMRLLTSISSLYLWVWHYSFLVLAPFKENIPLLFFHLRLLFSGIRYSLQSKGDAPMNLSHFGFVFFFSPMNSFSFTFHRSPFFALFLLFVLKSKWKGLSKVKTMIKPCVVWSALYFSNFVYF